jgi:sensor histidine kinase YesM
MAGQESSRRRLPSMRTVLETLLPLLAFTLGFGLATGHFLIALITGLAMMASISVLYKLDERFIRPRLRTLSQDWLQLGLEMTFSLFEHILGAALALLVCSRIFDFEAITLSTWIALGGILIAFPLIHGTETALRYYRQLREKERLEKQLRSLAAQAELTALKAQINPHFLFNTLNTIAQLVYNDPALAEATVERLAELLRYVLAGSERGLVPLEEELAFVEGYLEIERARFGERLRVTRQVAPEALSVPVPSLLLQPLVENAVEHGHGDDGSITLDIRVESANDGVSIAVADRGPGMPAGYRIGDGSGHGLRNVDERLRKTYGRGLEVEANEPRGTVVTIHIPV